MGGHAARRDNKQKALEKLNLRRQATTKATLAKRKPKAAGAPRVAPQSAG